MTFFSGRWKIVDLVRCSLVLWYPQHQLYGTGQMICVSQCQVGPQVLVAEGLWPRLSILVQMRALVLPRAKQHWLQKLDRVSRRMPL